MNDEWIVVNASRYNTWFRGMVGTINRILTESKDGISIGITFDVKKMKGKKYLVEMGMQEEEMYYLKFIEVEAENE